MKGLLGRKLGMTQVFEEDGTVVPVTLIQAGPCYVTQIKSAKTDGYGAVQLGFGEVKPRRLSRGQMGHLGRLPVDSDHAKRKPDAGIPPLRHLVEFRTSSPDTFQVGQQLTVAQFEPGNIVDVSGRTKGRGFQGGVKRHGFSGGPKTHGQSDRHRAPGSIGATSGTAHVFKGTRMAGHMGDARHTVQNLEVVRVDPQRHVLAVKGAVPGTKGGLVIIRAAVKSQE